MVSAAVLLVSNAFAGTPSYYLSSTLGTVDYSMSTKKVNFDHQGNVGLHVKYDVSCPKGINNFTIGAVVNGKGDVNTSNYGSPQTGCPFDIVVNTTNSEFLPSAPAMETAAAGVCATARPGTIVSYTFTYQVFANVSGTERFGPVTQRQPIKFKCNP